MRRVIDGVYVLPIKFGYVNLYLLEARDGLALIDTGLAGSAENIEAALRILGRSWNDVKHILITHAHPDHIGSLADVQRLTDSALTYAHRREALVIRGEMSSPAPRPESLRGLSRLFLMLPQNAPAMPARVDVELKGGDVLNAVYPGLMVVDEPGHAPGQVGFWLPDKRLLFAGDVVMRMPWGLVMPLAFVTLDMDEAKRSIRKVAALDIEALCPGHGPPLVANAAATMRDFAARQSVPNPPDVF
ncbi:MAG: MBL fold metallo-hydrolase [Burkholderiales bacterium]|nr:MBL fold metallo-hydrolase [Anaerolineae bacterium]